MINIFDGTKITLTINLVTSWYQKHLGDFSSLGMQSSIQSCIMSHMHSTYSSHRQDLNATECFSQNAYTPFFLLSRGNTECIPFKLSVSDDELTFESKEDSQNLESSFETRTTNEDKSVRANPYRRRSLSYIHMVVCQIRMWVCSLSKRQHGSITEQWWATCFSGSIEWREYDYVD